jgi:outer membrane protein OmpA-like peptidoglycan-associated protein
MPRMNRRLWVILCCLAPALASAEAVDVALNGRAQLGKSLPSVEIRILEPIAGFELTLQRSDGKTLSQKGGGPPGVTRSVQLQQPEGKFRYQGELVVVFPNRQRASLPLDFEAELWGPLRMSLEKGDVDVAGRKVRFRTSRPVVRAHVEVLMDTGEVAFKGEVPLPPQPAGTPQEVTWPETKGRVMRVHIQAYDESTYFAGVELFPWQVDIPHEEVNFDSGKWEVRWDQEDKLEASFKLIAEAVTRYGKLANLRLYVAGHTDTVGPTEGNRTLSVNRARALGAWFRKRGLRIPIYYEGFGEQALMVATPDGTDEAQNRRAEYIIAVDEPVLGKTPFPPQWRKL